MKCPKCRERDLVVLQFKANGTEVQRLTCSPCDLHEWRSDGVTVNIRSVLDLVSDDAASRRSVDKRVSSARR